MLGQEYLYSKSGYFALQDIALFKENTMEFVFIYFLLISSIHVNVHFDIALVNVSNEGLQLL